MSPVLFTILAVTAMPPQPGAPGKLDAMVLDAITACPKGPDGEIVVCAHSRGVAQPYRLKKLDPRYVHAAPAQLPAGPAAGSSPASGTCSTVGTAGATGCALDAANAWGAGKREDEQNGRLFPW